MEISITAKKLNELPNEIFANVQKYETSVGLLDKDICNRFYSEQLKEQFELYFKHFKNIKYVFSINLADKANMSKYHNSFIKQKHILNTNILSSLVGRHIDSLLWGDFVYYGLLNVSITLTKVEAIYLVNHLLKGDSESAVAKELHIDRKTLQHPKESCIVKLWFAFGNDLEND